jgi:hypothetical protein
VARKPSGLAYSEACCRQMASLYARLAKDVLTKTDSPCIRGAPLSGFSLLIRRMRSQISRSIPGTATNSAGFPAPIGAKPAPMPPNNSLGLDHIDRNRGEHSAATRKSADRSSRAAPAAEPYGSLRSPADAGQCFRPRVSPVSRLLAGTKAMDPPGSPRSMSLFSSLAEGPSEV